MKKILTLVCAAGTLSFSHSASAADYCREFTKPVTIGGMIQDAYGTACRQPDGTWQIISMENTAYSPTQVQQITLVTREVVPVYRPVYYQPRPMISFSFGNVHHRHYKHHSHFGHHKHGHHKHYDHRWHRKHHSYVNRIDRHDNHHRGRGRGHGGDRHRH